MFRIGHKVGARKGGCIEEIVGGGGHSPPSRKLFEDFGEAVHAYARSRC